MENQPEPYPQNVAKNADEIEKNKFAYKTLLGIRDLDSKMLWNRINIMIVIQSVLISFVGNIIRSDLISIGENYFVILIIGFFGLLTSILQFFTAQGGSFWVSYWEKKLASIEEESTGSVKIFRKHPSYDLMIRKEARKEGRVSTRKIIKVVSLLFSLLWLLIIVSIILLILHPNYSLYQLN